MFHRPKFSHRHGKSRIWGGRASGCDTLELVKQASSDTTTVLNHRIVDQDASPDNSWVVVKLDWDFPPYLEQDWEPPNSEQGGTPVRLMTRKASIGWEVVVDYRYKHQEDVPEGNTQVRLFGIERQVHEDTQSQETPEPRLIGEGIRQRHFLLPRNFEGFLQATVAPATSTKIGPQYASDLIWVSSKEHANGQEGSH